MIAKIEVVKFLIAEIEKQIIYNEEYEIARVKAKEETERDNGKWWFNSMPPGFDKPPNTSTIKDNCKMVRRLTLEVAKENAKNG